MNVCPALPANEFAVHDFKVFFVVLYAECLLYHSRLLRKGGSALCQECPSLPSGWQKSGVIPSKCEGSDSSRVWWLVEERTEKKWVFVRLLRKEASCSVSGRFLVALGMTPHPSLMTWTSKILHFIQDDGMRHSEWQKETLGMTHQPISLLFHTVEQSNITGAVFISSGNDTRGIETYERVTHDM